ncbi:hypothetical protein SAICODRAFT_31778 [Saitoella complicata NRRL Y-17804]|uniref:uncharacterized protein n=1 Tax=Saitoella complicata (strain BCRC 22490 / CBS 7301 / JCM 7358 / NBRC 10748 / NRRL Y-17804) TaxID=698492 RepID=UPI000867FA6D|nr:uncharacterized protein SAICODRAFT_31778 [Saitoella complicata NRRL Y-17804]ODQ50764.1 hypothetical protein SAICODRAFT_31778 [Saitoella complicata NRRL Y-17804]
MSSSEQDPYLTFLERANKSYESNSVHTAGGPPGEVMQVREGEGQETGKLRDVCERTWYASESDERFEAVVLDSLPEFNDEFTVDEWDTHGQYRALADAVRGAGEDPEKGHVKVYKVPGEGARVYYYVLTRTRAGGYVGGRVLSVET